MGTYANKYEVISMRNKIYTVSKYEICEIIQNSKNNNWYVAEFHGDTIKNADDYFNAIAESFCFPDLFNKYRCMDAYLDWIRDLSWLINGKKYDGFTMIIYNYILFMDQDYKRKEQIIRTFADTVLPYWEEEVIFTTNNGNGTPKPFNLYLIDG